jgi:hypothetical protein
MATIIRRPSKQMPKRFRHLALSALECLAVDKVKRSINRVQMLIALNPGTLYATHALYLIALLYRTEKSSSIASNLFAAEILQHDCSA